MTLQLTTLSNGLRVITDTVTDVESAAIGVWVDVGTRNENLLHNGVAHMVEHMMFNGTADRTSKEIAESIESLGGQINAYTSREMTAYYIHLLKDDVPMALDVLSDIIQHSTFPDKELEKERGVILQEIGMSNDTPDDLIYDIYQETAYPEQALGAPILGTADIVSNMQKETLFDYVQRFYTPSRLVISAAGNISHEEILSRVEDLFGDLPEDTYQTYRAAEYDGGECRMQKDLEQSHIVLGFQSISRNDPEYYTAVLLSTILGGGMSSRLFQEVREKRGLVYSVYASHSAFSDDGQFEIYAGTGPDKLPELMPVLCDEVQKTVQENVTGEELSRAKSQLRASILMSRESMLSRANRQAKHLLNFDRKMDIQDIIARIEAVSEKDIRDMAGRIFASRPTLAALGPLEHLEPFEKIEQKLAA